MTELLARPTGRDRVLIDAATVHDITALRQLYRTVYGGAYPLPLGTDPTVMRQALSSPTVRWRVARDVATDEVVGSAVLRTDPAARIGKVEGVAVHPAHAGAGVAHSLLSALCEEALGPDSELDSMYATARCVSPASQRALIRNGFRPFGLLPGAIEVHGRETLALLIRHRPGILAERAPLVEVSERVQPLLDAAREAAAINFDGRPARPATSLHHQAASHTCTEPGPAPLEVIQATEFVRRRYGKHTCHDMTLPLSAPDTFFTPDDGRFEAYAAIDPLTGCGVLLDVVPSGYTMGSALCNVVRTATERGVVYLETMVPLADVEQVDRYLAHGFVPSGVYPAMRHFGAVWHDYVVLTRVPRQPDPHTLSVDHGFTPYLKHYRSTCTSTLNSLSEDLKR